VLQAVIDGASIFVPAIWRLEVVNALVVAERRKKIAPGKSDKFLQDLRQFTITVDVDGLDQIFNTVLDQARLHQRSAYDASYLELTKRRGLPLATKDEPLKKAAEDSGSEFFSHDLRIACPRLLAFSGKRNRPLRPQESALPNPIPKFLDAPASRAAQAGRSLPKSAVT